MIKDPGLIAFTPFKFRNVPSRRRINSGKTVAIKAFGMAPSGFLKGLNIRLAKSNFSLSFAAYKKRVNFNN